MKTDEAQTTMVTAKMSITRWWLNSALKICIKHGLTPKDIKKGLLFCEFRVTGHMYQIQAAAKQIRD